jgi:hypothetical protein
LLASTRRVRSSSKIPLRLTPVNWALFLHLSLIGHWVVMVRRGAAAARDPNAPPAHEMEVHGLENPPRLLAQLAGGVSAFARNVQDGF